MTKTMLRTAPRLVGSACALSLGLLLSACGGIPTNGSLESIHQPVVERTSFTLDVTTGPGGLSPAEQRRVSGWFDAMDLRYGDRIYVDDPLSSTDTRSAVEALAGRHGLLVSDDAPVTAGYVNAGTARIVVTRSKAIVPGCPDWSARSDANPLNATSSNYGCAVNSNLATMVADPEHLLKGAETRGNTVVLSSNKAIDAYRDAAQSGQGGGAVKASSSKGN